MTTFEGTNPYRISANPKPGYVAQEIVGPNSGVTMTLYVESITTYAKRLVNERAYKERGTMPCPGPGKCALHGVPHEDLA